MANSPINMIQALINICDEKLDSRDNMKINELVVGIGEQIKSTEASLKALRTVVAQGQREAVQENNIKEAAKTWKKAKQIMEGISGFSNSL